jgi:solute carrier family 66, member 2
MSLLIESILGLPQAIQNFNLKSTKGLSLVLIGSWFAGDFFKTIYFTLNGLPIQFILCGIVQIIMDCIILLQMFIYQ